MNQIHTAKRSLAGQYIHILKKENVGGQHILKRLASVNKIYIIKSSLVGQYIYCKK